MRTRITGVLTGLFLLAFLGVRSTAEPLQKVIIDTDAGGDDALAILLALQAESDYKYEVIALTCSYGNTEEHNVEINVLKTLTIANRSDIAVYGGAEKPLLNDMVHDHFFGKDGFGDFEFGQEIQGKVDRSKHAAVALVELAKKYPNQITLLALGPLTNVATAIALDPSFLSRLQKLVVLGSSVKAYGQISPGAEFNFFQDPYSNFMVLNSSDSLVTLVPWETVAGLNISRDWRVNVLGKIDSTIVKFINNVERVALAGVKRWITADTVAAAIMIWPGIIDRSVIANVYPVIDGAAKGTVLVDYTKVSGRKENTYIVQSVDSFSFKASLLHYFS